jgi:hypothetical protein
MISHKWGNDWRVLTTNGTYPWSSCDTRYSITINQVMVANVKLWFLVITFSSCCFSVISQLLRYSRVCVQHSDFLDRLQLLTQNPLKQYYVVPRLKSSLKKIIMLLSRTGWPLPNIPQMTMDLFHFTIFFFPLSTKRRWPDLTVYHNE